METITQLPPQEGRDTESLFELYGQNHSIEIRNEIVRRFLYLPEILSKKFLGRGVDYDDLFQVGSMALIKSVERFDVSKGVKFVSFATPTILGEIKRFFRDKGSAIRIPRRIYEIYKKINLAVQNLIQEYERTPTVDEVAEYLGISPDLVLESMEAGSAQFIKSFDEPVNSEDDLDFHELIGQEDSSLDRIIDRDFVERSLGAFSDIEKEFLSMRYKSGKSQKVIADKLGVSQMYISRMERKVLQKLRRMINS
ncbi:MAG: sigma-70 family RNA polymerase sigma factor [Eubacteriales bacterium]|nr:sigma-70 family RNA polymerase sigma factor [Eubacteriales bacterium]